MVGMGIPQWQAGGICELLKLVDAEDASQILSTKDLETLIGRAPTSFKDWVSGVADAFKEPPEIKVYYWPTFGRAGAVIRMLDEGKLRYRVLSEVDEIKVLPLIRVLRITSCPYLCPRTHVHTHTQTRLYISQI